MASLLAAGYSVRALVRSMASGRSLPAEVECVLADVTVPSTLAPLMVKADAVISVIGGRAPLGRNGFRCIDWQGNRALRYICAPAVLVLPFWVPVA